MLCVVVVVLLLLLFVLYPADNKELLHEAGQKNSYAYFGMKFYCIDNAGHVGVQVNLEENVATQYRKEEKDKLNLLAELILII